MPILSFSVSRSRCWSWAISLVAALTVFGALLATDARAELADGKYGAAQVFDVQRSPAFPVANQNFTVSNFQRPYRATAPGEQYTMTSGQYIQFFRANDYVYPSNCTYGIRLYNSDDSLAATIADSGKVYGLGSEGFLHVSIPGGYGTFVANSAGYALGGSLSYLPTTGEANCDQLAAFVPNTVPTDVPTPPPATPVLSGLGVSGVGGSTATLQATSSVNATGYWIAVPQGSAAPTAAQVKAGVNYGAVTVAAQGNGAMTAATSRTFPISSLSSQTAYAVYVVAESATPTFSTVGGPLNFATADVTPPVTANGPQVTAVDFTSATVSVTTNEAATGYWMVLPEGDPAPDVAALIAGGTSVAMSSGVAAGISLSPLLPGTAYRFYFVARDAANNTQASVASVAVTTLTPASKSTSGNAPDGGTIGVAMIGGGLGCGLASTTFQTAEAVGSARMPAGYRFPYGVFGFASTDCGAGTTVTFTLTYPEALPPGTLYLKYGTEPDKPTPHWYVYPATINGNQITFSITDNGAGDSNPALGFINDPGGPVVPSDAVPVPTLSEWMLAVLSSLLALSLFVTARRRRG